MSNISPMIYALSENDKRLLFSVFLVVIFIVAIIGLLSYLIVRIIKWQGRRMDTLVHDVVVTKVIIDKKHFLSYGRKKNYALFFKQTFIPIIIVLVGLLIWIIKCSIDRDFSYNPFNTETGFGTLFWTWKFSGEYTEGTWIKFNKIVIDNYPHLTAQAWAGYLACPCFLTAITWYFISTLGFIGRTYMLYKRSKEIFEKSLEGYNQNEASKSKIEDDLLKSQQ